MQTCFSEFQGKNILKCPKFETRCLAHASWIEAQAIFVLGVHSSAFAQQQLRSRDAAEERCRVQRREASGGFFPETRLAAVGFQWYDGAEADAPRMTNVVGMLSSMPVQPTKERWIFWTQQLQTVQSKIYAHTSQTDRTNFMAFCFQQITFNETLSIINSLIVCLQKLKRLWKTMSSSKPNS